VRRADLAVLALLGITVLALGAQHACVADAALRVDLLQSSASG
jgi:hypothetical protein